MLLTVFFATATLIISTFAKRIVITVGGNTTSNPGAVFSPQSVQARTGDVVFFNFTQGNHTATQSTFAFPCTPAHFTNSTVNGFDTSFRDTHNGTAITDFSFTVQDDTTPVWFFDWNTCRNGGVGAININDTSLQTLAGFTRNAIRLNGTDSANISSTGTQSATSTATSASTSGTSTSASGHTSAANRVIVTGFSGLIPMFLWLLFLAV